MERIRASEGRQLCRLYTRRSVFAHVSGFGRSELPAEQRLQTTRAPATGERKVPI